MTKHSIFIETYTKIIMLKHRISGQTTLEDLPNVPTTFNIVSIAQLYDDSPDAIACDAI